MASSVDYIEFVCEQIMGIGDVRYKKMFGEYMVYLNDKPVFLVCNNTVYLKPLEVIKDKMQGAEVEIPYQGAKERYVLDIENPELAKEVALLLEEVTPIPRPKKRKTAQ